MSLAPTAASKFHDWRQQPIQNLSYVNLCVDTEEAVKTIIITEINATGLIFVFFTALPPDIILAILQAWD